MSNRHNDINDDEIRIISASEGLAKSQKRRHAWVWWIVAALALAVLCVAAMFMTSTNGRVEDEVIIPAVDEDRAMPGEDAATVRDSLPEAFTERRDTLVDGVKLSIFTARNASPRLVVGNGALADSAAVLIAQAADVRSDNGEIAGTFVVDGEVVGKGEAKAGYCSIVNGEITVGVADATPMLEQALMTDGYFFRQYPLVVGGQVVENKPKGKAIRKALAEIDGSVSVIVSNSRVTFHDFSEALVDAGVRNAIYLVGGSSMGRYRDAAGQSFSFGQEWDYDIKNVNYIVWR